MKINPMVMPIRMWQAGIDFWQDVAIAQLQMNRCALTMMGLWPSEQIKALGTAKAKPAANRPEAASAARLTAPVKSEPVKAEARPAAAAKPEPAKVEAAKPAPAKAEAGKPEPVTTTPKAAAAPTPARRRVAAGGQAKSKATPRRKGAVSTPKAAEPAPMSDTRH